MLESLPAEPANARSLTAVLPEVLASLERAGTWLRPARSAIVFVVDGLGAAQLSARAGHARTLAAAMGKRDTARTVFPSTTAAALTSLLTGTPPGTHGLLGYTVRVPGTDVVANQLKGWGADGLDPYTWQRATPILFEQAASGRLCFVVSRPEFEVSGFTEATMRGATFVGASDLSERVAAATQLAIDHDGALIYLYAPELDSAGHKYGWESGEWEAALEDIDAAVAQLARTVPRGIGVVVTADHGMVDVPSSKHVLLDEDDQLISGIDLIGGEPRMLHLYAHPGEESAIFERWRQSESHRSWVFTREQAVSSGLFGPVDRAVLSRIGDVIVAARSDIAYYDNRLTNKTPQRMIGQHGSLTPAERVVPLIRLGAYA
ncbi:putative AlkP superfamily pyrophosphatase or phosphodiesterase [Microbacterium endophyticum]|uniref:Putative AlkP superfamily pyrophosphatase or phosphodiesterase n=1 Tax=Microbacterium endophyticum TaxID=1526412 RepID=A0A7W4YMZ3_9MICO|nr:nucleotide pyrophosphatase/phosphodiesterase family protein [Microbacterium endophyticum]MBB2976975.1 putative AlkP superfamily pyrophosphatase or phosphodiesterase [Microbacterium endophyticum]NIK36739.1 putative AlkP superfamily pyrophosphatase or phosphodiesterase [Microbacterium endophyticum]